MPIFLSAIPRRRFLQGVLAGTVLAGLPLRAEEAADPRDVWALLSDTHIPGDRNRTGGSPPVRPVGHLAKIREDILSGSVGKPGAVIVSGDCVYMEGLPEDYATLLEEFRPFRRAGMDVHFVMGNHDNRRAFLDAVAAESGQKAPEAVPDRLTSVLETPKANFFLLDSLTETNRSQGRFGDEQLRWLADELDARRDKPAILVAHHYPDYTRRTVSNPHALGDTEDFYRVIVPRKQVKAFVFGHSHLWRLLKQDAIHLVNLPATAWRFDPAQPFAWVLMQLRGDGMTLRLRSIDPEHPKHDQQINLAWRR